MNRYLAAILATACATAAAQTPLRDPFARPAPPARAAVLAAAPAPEAKPRLRAIMFEPGHSLANIEGRILAEGEWYGDYQLVKVRERSVTVARRGAQSVLGLDEESSK
jgi:hypothetical protein